ncbi:hypothetical protein NW767_005453 [Fusarium falciforme]|nr:hypothetical protein NW767_005453 [Fusarium falciforme]
MKGDAVEVCKIRYSERSAIEEEMFGNAPHTLVAMDASGQVRRVIFRSFHGQYAFRNDSLRRGALWDMIYNAACEMAGVEVQKHTFFEYCAMVTQGRADSSLKAMVGNGPNHNMWKALQRRESDGVLLMTIPLLREMFPRLLAKVPTLVADMEDAVSKGYSPLYTITSYLSGLTVATKTTRRSAVCRGASYKGALGEEAVVNLLEHLPGVRQTPRCH